PSLTCTPTSKPTTPRTMAKRPEPIKLGLVGACDDRRVLGCPLWPKQREIIASVEAGPRLHVWALGRRSGKTTMAALVGLWDCLLRPDLAARVRPGGRGVAERCHVPVLPGEKLVVRALAIPQMILAMLGSEALVLGLDLLARPRRRGFDLTGCRLRPSLRDQVGRRRGDRGSPNRRADSRRDESPVGHERDANAPGRMSCGTSRGVVDSHPWRSARGFGTAGCVAARRTTERPMSFTSRSILNGSSPTPMPIRPGS